MEKQNECNDKNCPIHGSISTRGRTFYGVVLESKMNKTVKVSWDRVLKIPKYERFIRKSSKVFAHAPECMNIKTGDNVKIVETKPLSKMKHFVVVEKLSKK